MAFPTAVNDQITDSVTQVNTKVLGEVPAIAVDDAAQALHDAIVIAENSVTNAMQQASNAMQAATRMAVESDCGLAATVATTPGSTFSK